MQHLHGTKRDSERKRAKIGDSERHAATPWYHRDIERQASTMRNSERHVATPWD